MADDKTMKFEDFAKSALERFGNVVTGKVKISDETKNVLLGDGWTEDMIAQLLEYEQVWISDGRCPKCVSELGGFFGSFTWGIVHGEGKCSDCSGAYFRYYHIFTDPETKVSKSFTGFSLIGF